MILANQFLIAGLIYIVLMVYALFFLAGINFALNEDNRLNGTIISCIFPTYYLGRAIVSLAKYLVNTKLF